MANVVLILLRPSRTSSTRPGCILGLEREHPGVVVLVVGGERDHSGVEHVLRETKCRRIRMRSAERLYR